MLSNHDNIKSFDETVCEIKELTSDHDRLGVAVLEEGDVPAGDEAGVQPRGRHGGRAQLQPTRILGRDVVTLRREINFIES